MNTSFPRAWAPINVGKPNSHSQLLYCHNPLTTRTLKLLKYK
jgi:hypothetical protein